MTSAFSGVYTLRSWSKIPLSLALPLSFLSPPLPLAPPLSFSSLPSYRGRKPLISSSLSPSFTILVSRGLGFLPWIFFSNLDGCRWNLMHFWTKYDHSTNAFFWVQTVWEYVEAYFKTNVFDYGESQETTSCDWLLLIDKVKDDVHMADFSTDFYPRDAMLARVIAIATCLSVRLWRAGIVSKRRKLASSFLHHLVAPRH